MGRIDRAQHLSAGFCDSTGVYCYRKNCGLGFLENDRPYCGSIDDRHRRHACRAYSPADFYIVRITGLGPCNTAHWHTRRPGISDARIPQDYSDRCLVQPVTKSDDHGRADRDTQTNEQAGSNRHAAIAAKRYSGCPVRAGCLFHIPCLEYRRNRLAGISRYCRPCAQLRCQGHAVQPFRGCIHCHRCAVQEW